MVLYYQFNNDEFEYDLDYSDIEEFLKHELSAYTLKEIVEFIVDHEGDSIYEIFYEQLYDYFREKALKRYADIKQQEKDLIYDYLHDKL